MRYDKTTTHACCRLRIAPAIALLEALDVGQFEHDGLRVLHFGH